MPAPRLASRSASLAVVAAVVPLVAVSCETTGPRAIAEGRAVYNDVITRTADEQVLGMVVKHRYDESFGMLDVTAVTSQLHVTAETAINVGAGDSDSYEGNLVPFSAGLTYEEAPTISYVPMSGEALMTRLVAPVTLAQALTVGQLSRVPGQTFGLMVNRVNGLTNASGGGGAGGVAGDAGTDFRRVGELLAAVQTQGCGDYVGSGDAHYLLLHDYQGAHEDLVRELLQKLRLTAFEPDGRELLIPIRPGLGRPPQGDAMVVETRSVLDLLRVVGDEIEIPAPHLEAGLVAPAPAPPAEAGATPFIRVRSAPERPRDATVAVAHRGWWFYIDATDVASKRDFVLLRAVISMGLESEPKGHLEPVLTLPVGG